MQREVAKYLYDVLKACRLIERFVIGKSFADYESDEMLRAAVEREFIIIGEALTQAEKLDRTAVDSLTGKKAIIGFRNVLVHAYSIIRDDMVWGAVENHLPKLIREVQTLLANAPAP